MLPVEKARDAVARAGMIPKDYGRIVLSAA